MNGTQHSLESPEALVRRICAGADPEAEACLVSRYARGVRILLERRTRTDAEAEDLVQETFALALAKLRAGELSAPLAGVPVVLLGVLRGDGEPPIVATRAGAAWALAVDVGADPRITRYAVTLLDERGETRFERRGLVPDDLEVIELTFPGDFLPPGDYRLVVRGTRSGGETVEVGSYAFRVAREP